MILCTAYNAKLVRGGLVGVIKNYGNISSTSVSKLRCIAKETRVQNRSSKHTTPPMLPLKGRNSQTLPPFLHHTHITPTASAQHARKFYDMYQNIYLLLYSASEHNRVYHCAGCAFQPILMVRGRECSVTTMQLMPCREVSSVMDARGNRVGSRNKMSEGLSLGLAYSI
jgi:hypothetical protein